MMIIKKLKKKLRIKKHFKECKRNIRMRFNCMTIRTDSNTVLFSSFRGKQYSDNPRAISEKLHDMMPDVKIIWLIDHPTEAMEIPKYVTSFASESKEAYKAFASAKVWVFNNDLPFGTYKGRNQHYIQTWHGDRGFKLVRYEAQKAMGIDKYKALSMIEDKICDLCVAGSDEGEQKYRNAFHFSGEVLKVGCPRNDILVQNDKAIAEAIKEKLNIKGKKVLLYAPTFRDDDSVQMEPLNLNKVKETLEETTGDQWIILVRAHSLAKNLKLDNTLEYVNVSDYRDMAELLLVTDVLISDYSSTVNDFALLGRPIYLYLSDFHSYTEDSRSLKYDPEKLGYFVAYNNCELISLLRQIKNTDFKVICNYVLEKYGTNETGLASAKTCEQIKSWIS